MKFVILRVYDQNYFDATEGVGQFRSIYFASLYNTKEEAYHVLYNDVRIKEGAYQILEIYIKS